VQDVENRLASSKKRLGVNSSHTGLDCPFERFVNVECTECGELGHRQASCPNPVCVRCQVKGHRASVCPLNRCRLCGGDGHGGQDCANPLVCAACGHYGHTADECATTENRGRGLRKRSANDTLIGNEEARGTVAEHFELEPEGSSSDVQEPTPTGGDEVNADQAGTAA
jgi:Zinc knuckle